MSTNTLAKWQAKPLFPTPLEKEVKADAKNPYQHLESPEKLVEWLDKLPWNKRLWTAGQSLRAQSSFFKNLQEPLRSQLLITIAKYVNQKQKKNGFFGRENEEWHSDVSGTYKIISFYEINGISIPNIEAIKKTTLQLFYEQEIEGTIVLYNIINMLTIIQRNSTEYSESEKLNIIKRSVVLLEILKAPDGGFYTQKDKPTDYSFKLGEKVKESNANATGLAHKTRALLYELTSGTPPPHQNKSASKLLDVLKETP